MLHGESQLGSSGASSDDDESVSSFCMVYFILYFFPTPQEIIDAEGMKQITDSVEIEKFCREAVEANPEKAEEFRRGKQALMGFFVGLVMKASRGQANPKQVNEILRQLLG